MLIKLVYLNSSINKEIYLSYSKDFVLKNDELLNNIYIYIYIRMKKKKNKIEIFFKKSRIDNLLKTTLRC